MGNLCCARELNSSDCRAVFFYTVNLLQPAGYVMHHQYNIQQFYIQTTLYWRVLYLSQNSPAQHKQIGFYNRDEKCLQRGTNWVFK
jgi:hypothetical protein